MSWNPDLYHKFQNERFAPFEDLLTLVNNREGLKVLDLGCGTGELTLRLSRYLPGSEVLGIDSSKEMLERAQSLSEDGLGFEQLPIEEVSGSWDLIFSNAAIQWVNNHNELIPKLFSLLCPYGQMVIQLPSNHNHDTQSLVTETAREEPFKTALEGWTRKFDVLTINEYAELLYSCGAHEINVFEKVYPHVLSDSDAIVEWVRGTALIPYTERLPEEYKEQFIDAYRDKIKQIYKGSPVFYPFRRILFSAVRTN